MVLKYRRGIDSFDPPAKSSGFCHRKTLTKLALRTPAQFGIWITEVSFQFNTFEIIDRRAISCIIVAV
jgi:hypothetical protein